MSNIFIHHVRFAPPLEAAQIEAYITQNFKIWSWFPIPLLTECGFGFAAEHSSVLHACKFGQNRLEGCTSVKHYWNVSLPTDFSPLCSVSSLLHKSHCLWFFTGSQIKDQWSFQVFWVYLIPPLVLSLSSANTLPSSHYFHLNHLVNQIWQRQGGLTNSLGF